MYDYSDFFASVGLAKIGSQWTIPRPSFWWLWQRRGASLARNQLCGVYGERVHRIIRLHLDQKLLPKLDVVQDALILALGGLKDFTYRNEGNFLWWLTRIIINANTSN